MADRYVVVIGAGTLREEDSSVMPHESVPDGVSVRWEAAGTHVLHMAVAGGVLDHVYRVARERRLPVHGVQVRAEGALERTGDDSVGVEYTVAIDSGLLPEEVDALVGSIDPVAELPEHLHAGVDVRRVGHL